MDEATIALTVVTGVVGAIFLGFLIWGIKSGQFRRVEDTKYQVFREQEKSQNNGENSQETHEGGESDAKR